MGEAAAAGGESAGDFHENFRQQLEEAVALQAIYEDDFRVFRMSSEGHSPEEDLDPEALLEDAACTSSPLPLVFELLVHVELPPGGLQLQLPAARRPNSGGPGDAAAGAEEEAGVLIAAGDPVQYLTPLCLVLHLPRTYPGSCTPPAPQLSARWLSCSQAQALVQALLGQGQDSSPGPVCYLWVEWLKQHALAQLGATACLTIPTESSTDVLAGVLDVGRSREEAGGGGEQAAGEAVWDAVRRAEETAMNLMRYAASRSTAAFARAVCRCPICMDDVVGSRCVRLAPGCAHVYCAPCFETYCRTLAAEGAVERINCPDPSCRLQVPPHVLRSVLSEDEFARWEALALKKALDRMTDVVYCPRCQGICIEDKDQLAQCPQCLYVFCSNCFMSWHPTEPCLDPVAVLELRKKQSAVQMTEAERKRREQDFVNQIKSMTVVRDTSKPCPSCGMAIEKFAGCNKVICSCGTYFCYKCGQAITGYDHFSANGCQIFENAEVHRWEMEQVRQRIPPAVAFRPRAQRQEGGGAGAGRPPPQCPMCGQWNVRIAGNNNIRCWSCTNNFCGLCREPLRRGKAGQHFGPSGCKQHSLD